MTRLRDTNSYQNGHVSLWYWSRSWPVTFTQWFVQNHCGELKHCYDHQLRYTKTTQCSKPPSQYHFEGVMELISMIKVYDWITAMSVETAYVEPGSPSQKGCCKSLNARFRDESLNGEISYSLKDAQILIKRWRQHYNTVRLYSAFGYFSPCAREHHTSRPKSHYELTFNMDHLIGALQTWVFVPKV